MTTKYAFDLHDEDVYFCTADIGWITGHTYIVYGPLALGATTLMFEGHPSHPHNGRLWEIAQKHKVTVLYTSPTAVRSIMRFGSEPVKAWDRSSIRIFGSVGEPIGPEVRRTAGRVNEAAVCFHCTNMLRFIFLAAFPLVSGVGVAVQGSG